MNASSKKSDANRHHGGPGSSHQRPDLADPTEGRGPEPGTPTNTEKSRVSGGGGERDSHHTHNPPQKGGKR